MSGGDMDGTAAPSAGIARFRRREGDALRDAELADALARDGVCILENTLSPDEIAATRGEVLALAAAPPAWLKRHATTKGFLFSFSPVLVRKHGDDVRIARLAATFGERLLARVCRNRLGPLWYVDRVVLDRKEPSPEPITDWHADQFEARGRCLKFMLYLADTDAGNGAFSYVPGSHRLMEALVDRHERDNRDLHVIEDIRAKAAALIEAEPLAAAKVRGLLGEMEHHIASARRSDDHYSVAAPAGSIVVFDALGIHRGGIAAERERLVVRSHCWNFRLGRVVASRASALGMAERLYLRLTAPAGTAGLV